MKKENGITLIALVITIIVLIILAGVSINLVLGDNGIITKAKWAKKTYGEEAVREKVTLILGEYITEENETNQNLHTYLEQQATAGKIESTEENQDGTQSVVVDDYIVTIDENTLEIIDVSKLGPRPMISNIKITVVNEVEGTEIEAKENEVEPGTPLKITFDVSFEEGIIVGVNKGTLNNGKVEYTTDGKETEAIFIVTGKIEEECRKVQKVALKKFYKKIELNAEDIAQNPMSYYGELVTNYTCPSEGVEAWRIFYADEMNIYLIADNYLEASNVPNSPNGTEITQNSENNLSFNNIVNDETYATGSDWIIKNSKAKQWLNQYLTDFPEANNPSVKATAYMLDTNIWSNYYAGDFAEYAIGGTTIEMWCESYRDTHPNRYKNCYVYNTMGYRVNEINEGEYTKGEYNGIYSEPVSQQGTWIASPNATDNAQRLFVAGERTYISRKSVYLQ